MAKRSARLKAPVAPSQAAGHDPRPKADPVLTVGIGASAGGLQAFTSFLEALPSDTGMAFVLVQHLDPAHRSLLVELLAKQTAMPVVEATDGMMLAPDTVFVIPPDATMTLLDGALVVSRPAPPRAARHPIDSCFISLARDRRRYAVAIVLAGLGGDGSLGLAEIKQHGGLVLAQAGEDGRALAGMPHSAVATGLVDQLLAVDAMPARLLAYQAALRRGPAEAGEGGDAMPASGQFAELCTLLRNRTGHDFSQYKQATLQRRIQRRMQALGVTSVAGLLDLLRRDPRQLDRLFHDMLIRVTQFLRDPAAFQVLRETVLPKLLAGKGAADSVRIWVPGCASGEEAYSLAILLRELLDHQSYAPKVQIFATDVDEDAIAIARGGRYPNQALARLTLEQRARWFIDDGSDARTARVIPRIREMCVFSVHNLARDPPFSHMDLISCRNLLIYLGPELQDRILRGFHYALNPDGVLFLGPSESVTRGGGLFVDLDKRRRIFRRSAQPPVSAALRFADPASVPPSPLADLARPAGSVEDAIDRRARRALEPFSPAYVVINRAHDIIRFSGGSTARFLEPSPGVASLNLFGFLRKPLRPAVRNAVQRVTEGREAMVAERLVLPVDGHSRVIAMNVIPFADNRNGRDLYVVAFQDTGLDRVRGGGARPAPMAFPAGVAEPGTGAPHELMDELKATRNQLITTVTELETANEELRSSNEEYQATNEELQATNEELETAKEEMQSVNEELQTINAELATKNDQFARLNNDIQNLMDSTQIATLFLDSNSCVTRFTPRVTELFRLRDVDIGRPIADIASPLGYTTMAADVTAVLDGQEIVERELRPVRGSATFLMQIRPYRTLNKVAEGVAVTFVDISASKRLEAELSALNQILQRRVTELEATGRALAEQTDERMLAEAMLRQAQKLEALGKLTGGIAHDFNNLLGVIILNAEILTDAMHDRPREADQVREILGSAERGAELTRRLLAFARQQPLQPRHVDLNALVRVQVATLDRVLGETIEVSTGLAPDLWPTSADPSQIGDALLNLAINARDAMPGGGSLRIDTSNVYMNQPDAAWHGGITAGDYVVLTVSDTGVGMPPAVVERATEPFFSTKPPSAGSGLGLSMIYGFARQSGGQLEIESQEGFGTTVRLFLPRVQATGAAVRDLGVATAPDPGGDAAVLVVDDNPALCEAARQTLSALGYRVRTAADGPAALALFRMGERFDLLFTDIVMPHGMTGYELATAARALQPNLNVLFATGYAGADRDPGQPTLLKPYRKEELATRVRAVLDAAPRVSVGAG